MPSVNMRELRNTRQLKAWLREGETVELRERDSVLAHIVPEAAPAKPVRLPDFAARAKKLFGRRRLPGADLVVSERGRF